MEILSNLYLNRHIRCIEIRLNHHLKAYKSFLNRHIRCIEILDYKLQVYWIQLEPTHTMYWNSYVVVCKALKVFLNRHIRCIEIFMRNYVSIADALEPTHTMYWNFYYWTMATLNKNWTDTYDLLKSKKQRWEWFFNCTWTDTYDVLKFFKVYWSSSTTTLEPTHTMYWNLIISLNKI